MQPRKTAVGIGAWAMKLLAKAVAPQSKPSQQQSLKTNVSSAIAPLGPGHAQGLTQETARPGSMWRCRLSNAKWLAALR